MQDQQKAYLYAFATVFFWSTVASAFKLSLRFLDPVQLLFVANLVSVTVLLLVLIVQNKTYLLLAVSRRELARSAVLGILNPFLYYLVLFKAYDLLPAQEAQPLNYTWAIALTLLSVPLLKQRVTRQELLAICISYFGVLIIATRGDPLALRFDSALGVTLALSSTVIWAVYWIYNTKDRRDPVVSLFLNFLLGLPFVTVAVFALSDFAVGGVAGLLGAAYVGIFEMGLAFVFWLNALRLTKSTAQIANLIFFSPFLSLIFIHFLVGEEIRVSTILGLIFIVAGNVLQRLGKNTAPPQAVAD